MLRRYGGSRSPEDLGEIARRHRPMVFRTCLRLAGNAHDAEDAAQSVFLAPAQRPEMIRHSLVGGLHELARAAVGELFRSRRRRLRREEEAIRQQEAARLAGCTTVAMGWRSMKDHRFNNFPILRAGRIAGAGTTTTSPRTPGHDLQP